MIDPRRAHWSGLWLFLLAISTSSSAQSIEVPEYLRDCGSADIARVVSGDTLLARSGEEIRLVSVKAPELWAPGTEYTSWPHARASQRYLSSLASETRLTLYCGEEHSDAFGKLMRHAALPNGDWVQGRLVQSGMAFVHPTGFSGSELDVLFSAEQQARTEKLGLWSERGPTLLAHSDGVQIGFYQIVDFTLHRAAEVGTTIYLNTDVDWRRDFTVEIDPKIVRKFDEASLAAIKAPGSQLEVRGWVYSRNGPTIRLSHPAQIRVLDD